MPRYAYNAQVEPPAPFVHVTLRNPLTGEEASNVPAQLDTAADRTLLPLPVAEALHLCPVGHLRIGGVGGSVQRMELYPVLLGVHDAAPRLIGVIAHADEPSVLLGRDVLNAHKSLLDGPALGLEID